MRGAQYYLPKEKQALVCWIMRAQKQ